MYEAFELAAESTIDELGELTSWEYERIFWDYHPRSGGGFYKVKYRVFREWSSGYRELVYGELAPGEESLDTFRICWMKEGSY